MSDNAGKRQLMPMSPSNIPSLNRIGETSTSSPKVRISLACIACKRRKAKCSGGPPPCRSCLASGTECIIDETLDGRRKASAKRTFDELTRHKAFIEGLLTCIRTFDEAPLEHLLAMIKADIPLQEIGALIDESLQSPLESPGIRNLKRKMSTPEQADDTQADPTTPESSQQTQFTFENQARQISDNQRIISFLENSSRDTVDQLFRYLRTCTADNLLQGLQQYVAEHERHDSTAATPISQLSVTGSEFNKGRHLSVPNLLGYQRYLQSLFAEHDIFDLEELSLAGRRTRKHWHPALKTNFSSTSTDTEEPLEAVLAGVAGPSMDQTSTSKPSIHERRRPDTDETRKKARATSSERNPKRSEPGRLHLDIGGEDNPRQFFPTALAMTKSHEQMLQDLPLTSFTSMGDSVDLGEGPEPSYLHVPLYLILPLTGIDESPMARSYTSYRDEARAMIAKGVPVSEVMDVDRTVVDLMMRPRAAGDSHSVCNWASEFCLAFRRDFEMPLLLAKVFLLSRLMKWILIPSEDIYNRVPEMIRPTRTQRFIPHNPAADLIPLPAIRDALCVRFRDFITPLIGSFHFSWPHSIEDAVELDPDEKQFCLTEEFEEYASNLDHWTLSRSVLDAFPEIAGRPGVNIVD